MCRPVRNNRTTPNFRVKALTLGFRQCSTPSGQNLTLGPRQNRLKSHVRQTIRRDSSVRFYPLVNEAELSAALQTIGFTILEPELLRLEDQIVIFASAAVIVGLGGAGLFNAVFAKPGTKIVTIEASNAFINNHATLFSSLNLDYAVIFGERNGLDSQWPHHNWTIDVSHTVARIKEFL